MSEGLLRAVLEGKRGRYAVTKSPTGYCVECTVMRKHGDKVKPHTTMYTVTKIPIEGGTAVRSIKTTGEQYFTFVGDGTVFDSCDCIDFEMSRNTRDCKHVEMARLMHYWNLI